MKKFSILIILSSNVFLCYCQSFEDVVSIEQENNEEENLEKLRYHLLGHDSNDDKLVVDSLSEENHDNMKDFNRDNRNDNEDVFASMQADEYFDAEARGADIGDLFGSNLHVNYPSNYAYSDLGRRFVPSYPYTEKAKKNLKDRSNPQIIDSRLVPKRASPELVLAVAKQSRLLENSRPHNPAEDLVQKHVLRSGNYWNSVWKEDVEPSVPILRSNKLRKSRSKAKNKKLDIVKARVYAGSRLHSQISKLQKKSPELILVINAHDDK